MRGNYCGQISFPLSRIDPLVESGILEITKTLFASFGHQDFVVQNCAACYIRSQDRAACGESTDHTTTIQHRLKFALHQCVQVRIDQTKLSPGPEPHTVSPSQRGYKGFGIGFRTTSCMKHRNMLQLTK